MTLQQIHIKKAERPRLGVICLTILLLFCIALMLKRADVAARCMREGLSLCARAVVPSLFPFMVLSELLVTGGAGEWLSIPLERHLGKRLGLSRAGCCAVLLGLLCGFPTGARCAILAYQKQAIDRSECERVLACSSIPSSAFLISTVGTTLWKNAKFGILLYIVAILSAILSGFFIYAMQKRKDRANVQRPPSHPAKVHFEIGMFPTAIKNATVSTLLICAYVVFFCTLTGTVELVINRFAESKMIHAILSAALELSGGVDAAAKLQNRKIGAILTGAAVGWSGLSVHCQMLSLCDGQNVSTKPYLWAKLVQAITCTATTYFISLVL